MESRVSPPSALGCPLAIRPALPSFVRGDVKPTEDLRSMQVTHGQRAPSFSTND